MSIDRTKGEQSAALVIFLLIFPLLYSRRALALMPPEHKKACGMLRGTGRVAQVTKALCQVIGSYTDMDDEAVDWETGKGVVPHLGASTDRISLRQ